MYTAAEEETGGATRGLTVCYDSHIELTIHDAFLASAGLLQCDPIARVHLVTVKTTHPSLGATGVYGTAPPHHSPDFRSTPAVTICAREVGHTAQKLFTAHPNFGETLTFSCAHNTSLTALAGRPPPPLQRTRDAPATETVEDYVVITMENGDGTECYGQAYCPFSPHCPSTATAAVRAMLRPRNAQDPRDPLFRHDCATLAARRLDHFGYVAVSWTVTLIPHGGALFVPDTTVPHSEPIPPSPPVGLVLCATWLAPATGPRGAHYTTSVEFDQSDRFLLDSAAPLRLTVHKADQLERAVFHCAVQHVQEPELSCDVAVALPLPSLSIAQAYDRDVHWAAPVRTAQGRDWGMLLVRTRLTREPDGASALTVAPGPETAETLSRVVERERRRACVQHAAPSVEHLRHLFEVLLRRTPLDPGVARVGALFFDHPDHPELTASELKELMVSCAFHCTELTVQQAARFCFVALRHSVPDAVSIDEVHYMLQHCLVGRTVHMTEAELRRVVTDIFGNVTLVGFADFTRYFLHNYAVWAELGVPLRVDLACSSAQRTHHALPLLATSCAAEAAAGLGVRAPPSAPAAPPVRTETVDKTVDKTADKTGIWRTFVVRVPSTHKAFSVTAHVNDTVAEVMAMTEGSVGIRAARQEWRLNGELPVDIQTPIGNTALGLPSALKCGATNRDPGHKKKHGGGGVEVWVREREEQITLTFHYKEKHRRWRESVAATMKVLQLRAAVQRRTLIPLSRCVLTVRQGGGAGVTTALQDRHPLSYYQLQTGDTITVSQE